MTEPVFDHERLDVYGVAIEYEHEYRDAEYEHEKKHEQQHFCREGIHEV